MFPSPCSLPFFKLAPTLTFPLPTLQLILTRLTNPSIGLDTCLAIQQTLYEGTRDSKYRPSVLLERMVDAQWYGRKNGKGFYEYSD
jgi:3-hydroxyacyl-CoA dehydrogenase